MNITAQKWGNSLAVRLPKYIVQKAHLSPGVQLSICIDSQGNIEMISAGAVLQTASESSEKLRRSNSPELPPHAPRSSKS